MADESHEFNKYYNNTYIRYNRSGESGILLVDGVSAIGERRSDIDSLVFVGRSKSGKVKKLKVKPKTYDTILDYPTLGMRNVNGCFYPVSLGRRPGRQWKKGFRFSGVSINILGTSISALTRSGDDAFQDTLRRLGQTDLTSELLQSALYPEYYSLEEAISLIESGDKIGVALDDTVSVIASNINPQPLIAYGRRFVGVVGKKSATICQRAAVLKEKIAESLEMEVVVQ